MCSMHNVIYLIIYCMVVLTRVKGKKGYIDSIYRSIFLNISLLMLMFEVRKDFNWKTVIYLKEYKYASEPD